MAIEHQPISDEELARQTQAGSLSDFEELVSRYEGRIFRFVVNICRNETDAREVTQEVFVTAYQKIGQFDPARSFAAWLFTMARRKCIDHHRVKHPSGEESMPELADTDDPAAQLERREAEQDLWNLARRVLPELQYQAFWLRYAEEMNIGEIGRVLRKTQTHIKVLLFRARSALARELKNLPAGRVAIVTGKNSAGVSANSFRSKTGNGLRGLAQGFET